MNKFNDAFRAYEKTLALDVTVNLCSQTIFPENGTLHLFHENNRGQQMCFWFTLMKEMNGDYQFCTFDIRNICAYAGIELKDSVKYGKDHLAVVIRLLKKALKKQELDEDCIFVLIKNSMETFECGVSVDNVYVYSGDDFDDSDDVPF